METLFSTKQICTQVELVNSVILKTPFLFKLTRPSYKINNQYADMPVRVRSKGKGEGASNAEVNDNDNFIAVADEISVEGAPFIDLSNINSTDPNPLHLSNVGSNFARPLAGLNNNMYEVVAIVSSDLYIYTCLYI
jgi:hypothetical protein